ncbi:MAG: hypothetical protein ABIU54_15090, partial [Candidatus Eisenbacteria bacterium]
MRVRGKWLAVLVGNVLGMTLLGADGIQAQGLPSPVSIRLGTGSALWIEGKSNLHDFESRTTTVTVKLTRGATVPAPATPADLESLVRGSFARGLEVEVPVMSLHSK